MLDEQTKISLRSRYNPDGSLLRRHQLCMLEMLLYFDEICKKHNIKYWICAGTLLGAIRHGGFIPWDDDLDVSMLREDFARLEEIWDSSLYFLQTHKSDPFYVAPYAKMRDKRSLIKEGSQQDLNYQYKGIYIDIFLVEPCPSVISKVLGIVNWRLLLFGSKVKSSLSKKVFLLLKKIQFAFIYVVRNVCSVFVDKNILRYSYGSGLSNYTVLSNQLFPLKEIFFEGYAFPTPANVEDYLSRTYGDYMQLPDLDKLHPHLTNISFIDSENDPHQ